MENPKKMCK